MKKEYILLLLLITTGLGTYFFIPFKEENIKKSDEIVSENLQTDNNDSKALNEIKESNNLSFDIVRITSNGDAVIAGQSKPGIVISLFDNFKKLATFSSDANGEWVWSSENPLQPGVRKFHLEFLNDKGNSVKSNQTIIVFLDENKKSEPLVVKSSFEGQKNSVVLNLEKIKSGITLDLVEYGSNGNVMLSGRATSLSKLSFFLDDRLIGHTDSDDQGFWNFESDNTERYGKFDLKIDLINNKKITSIVTPIFLEKIEIIKDNLEKSSFVVQPGNSLWRIARKTMGGGLFYTEIYKANMNLIRDPNLIYPGQVFGIPIVSELFANEK